MRKIALAVFFTFICVFSMNNAFANNDIDEVTDNTFVASNDCTDSPSAYVYDIRYNDDGSIVVVVRIKNREKNVHYRVKVTPKDKITGTIVEGALYGTVSAESVDCSVTFHCYSGKEGDAPYCRQYDFNVEIVG